MAIGDPFRLGHSVTVGVVSSPGRPFQVQDGRSQNLIQISVAINPGNSGGPLINVRGEVIGINTAVLAEATTGTVGIGFAVPINTIKALLPQLRAGQVVRGWLGIRYRVEPIAEDEAKALGLRTTNGVIVVGIEPGSPAARASVRAGDVIVGIDGATAADATVLGAQIAASHPGTQRTLTIQRDGQTRGVLVTIGERPVDDEGAPPVVGEGRTAFGLTLDDLTPSLMSHLRLPERIHRAVVTDLVIDGPADRAGLQAGDVITTIARRAVRGAGDARQALGGVGTGEPVFILLWRSGVEHFLEMRRP